MSVDYGVASDGYEHRRRPDPAIAAQLHHALGHAHTVLNVGAGAGSYEPQDLHVVAVEPSAAMRARRPADAVPAIDAAAEALPFDDHCVDAAMAVFTVHQWPDLAGGLRELRRVTRGPVVVLTIDGDALDGFWLGDYLLERMAIERERMPTVTAIQAALGGYTDVQPVPIPRDCSDGFVEAFYARPEALLDPAVRAAQSRWQYLDSGVVERGLTHLAEDLSTGVWDAKYGHLREQDTLVGPLCMVTALP